TIPIALLIRSLGSVRERWLVRDREDAPLTDNPRRGAEGRTPAMAAFPRRSARRSARSAGSTWSLRSKSLTLLGALLLVAAFLWLAVDRKDSPRQAPPRPAAQPLEGRIDFRSLDDIRVGGSRIILCGVVNGRPAAMGVILTDARSEE